jgi:hypothetical protein
MKRLLLVTAAFLAVGSAQAAENATLRKNVGVGLGTLLFEAAGADGLLSQTLAATTNGFFSNQLFFVTTGTGGATQPKGIVQNQATRDYIAANLDALARDIAAGHGESLDTLAELAGVTDRAAFAAKVQAHYAVIFTSADVTSEEVIENLAKVVA